VNTRFFVFLALLATSYSHGYDQISLDAGKPSFRDKVNYPRAYISSFVAGGGNARPWLSVIIKFDFDKQLSSEWIEKYHKYINSELASISIGTIKGDNEILFKLREQSISLKCFQQCINDANLLLDPKVESLRLLEVQDNLKRIIDAKILSNALEKQQIEEQIKAEARKKDADEFSKEIKSKLKYDHHSTCAHSKRWIYLYNSLERKKEVIPTKDDIEFICKRINLKVKYINGIPKFSHTMLHSAGNFLQLIKWRLEGKSNYGS
jgi:hypothetical protein